MHIVQVIFERVPKKLYGGTERVVEALCQGLTELGHSVTLMAEPGDYPLANINFVDMKGTKTPRGILSLLPKSADIVHYHLPYNQDEIHKNSLPYINTQHGNLTSDEDPSKLPRNTVFVSQSHAQKHLRSHFVYNGLDSSKIPFSNTPLNERNYFSFLGRASLKRKGAHHAKMVAKKLDYPLKIGGGRGLSWGNNSYLGHLDNQQKFSLLGESRGLLFPIEWDEPFGLVMIEAMFCGTPVFALNRGSVPEVLNNDLFIHAENIEQLYEKITTYNFSHNNPSQFRDYANKNFSHLKMCHGYLEKYQEIIDNHFLK